MELDDGNFNIEAVFDNVRSMVNSQAREKRLPIVLDLDGVPRWLRGDAAHLRQRHCSTMPPTPLNLPSTVKSRCAPACLKKMRKA